MTHNDNIKENLDSFYTAKRFAEDLLTYNKCLNLLKNYKRLEVISLIQDLIIRYGSQINQLGFLIDGRHVIYGVDYSSLSDIQIIDQLIYIAQRIPVYAFIREGESKIATDLLNRVATFGFDAYKQV